MSDEATVTIPISRHEYLLDCEKLAEGVITHNPYKTILQWSLMINLSLLVILILAWIG